MTFSCTGNGEKCETQKLRQPPNSVFLMPFLTANDVRLYYVAYGSGRPMVWAHAYPLSHRMWQPQWEHFSSRYRVIAYDARGMGQSDAPLAPDRYSQPLAVEDLRQLLRALGIERAIIGGLSMGGNVALHLGLNHPEMCDALILCDTGAGSEDPLEHRARVARYAQAAQQGIESFKRHLTSLPMFGNFVQKRAEFAALFDDIVSHHPPHGVAHVATQTIGARPPIYALQDRLRQLRVPTLVIVGEHDEPCIKVSQFMAATIPHAELSVVKGCGHFTNLEDPLAFNTAVEDFLRRRLTLDRNWEQ
ncbi:MAG: alpha/beta hydrolase, partial [Abditibacteriales bacterium]|nr:alpha/beta hydrolase [Abditibacteriales bacterium]